MRNQIIEEAEEYKRAFYEKRKVNMETNKNHNREREKVLLSGASMSLLSPFILYFLNPDIK